MVFHGFKDFEVYEASQKEILIKWNNLFKTSPQGVWRNEKMTLKETNKKDEEFKGKKIWHGVKKMKSIGKFDIIYPTYWHETKN